LDLITTLGMCQKNLGFSQATEPTPQGLLKPQRTYVGTLPAERCNKCPKIRTELSFRFYLVWYTFDFDSTRTHPTGLMPREAGIRSDTRPGTRNARVLTKNRQPGPYLSLCVHTEILSFGYTPRVN